MYILQCAVYGVGNVLPILKIPQTNGLLHILTT